MGLYSSYREHILVVTQDGDLLSSIECLVRGEFHLITTRLF